MRISELIMMLLVVGIFTIGGSLYLADLGTAYDVSGVPNLAVLNQTSEISNAINQTQTTMKTSNTGNPLFDAAANAWNFIGFMSSAFIRTGLLFLSTPSLLLTMLTNEGGNGLLDLLRIPSWITGIITVMIIAIITFAIYRTVAKSDI
jgi:hypothetical protein